MPSTRLDIQIEQGSTLYLTVNAKNSDGTVKNLNGYSAKMQVRPTVASNDIYVDATTSNGLISINGALGQVSVTIPGTTTAAYTWLGGVYDLKIENGSDIVRLLHGDVTLTQQVSR